MAESNLIGILRVLDTHGVEFIVVGGMAAVIGGAPIVTHDIDVLRRRSTENVSALLAALNELDAVYRGDKRGLRPDASHLAGTGHLLLETSLGQLDLLGALDAQTTYDEVLPDTYEITIEAMVVRVVTLERLLVIKRALGRPKDHLMALQIEATLEEQRRNKELE